MFSKYYNTFTPSTKYDKDIDVLELLHYHHRLFLVRNRYPLLTPPHFHTPWR